MLTGPDRVLIQVLHIDLPSARWARESGEDHNSRLVRVDIDRALRTTEATTDERTTE